MLQQPISVNLFALSLLPGHEFLDSLPAHFIFNPIFINKANWMIGNEMKCSLCCLFDQLAFFPVFVLFCVFGKSLNTFHQALFVRLQDLFLFCKVPLSYQQSPFQGSQPLFLVFRVSTSNGKYCMTCLGFFYILTFFPSNCPSRLRSGLTFFFTVFLQVSFIHRLSKRPPTHFVQ